MINRDEVKKLSELSKISLSEEEIINFERDLKLLLEDVKGIEDINTDHSPITYNVNNMKNPLRDEEVWESLPREEVLKNTSEKQYGYFKILRVMDE